MKPDLLEQPGQKCFKDFKGSRSPMDSQTESRFIRLRYEASVVAVAAFQCEVIGNNSKCVELSILSEAQ